MVKRSILPILCLFGKEKKTYKALVFILEVKGICIRNHIWNHSVATQATSCKPGALSAWQHSVMSVMGQTLFTLFC